MSKETKTVAQLLKEKYAAFKAKFATEEPKTFGTNTMEDGTVLSWEGDLAVDTVVSIGEGEDAVIAPPATYVLTGDMEGTSAIVGEDGKVTELVTAEPDEDDKFSQAQLDEAVGKAVKLANAETEKKFNTKFTEMNTAFSEMSELIEKLPAETPGKKKFSTQTGGKTLSFHQQRLIDNLEKK